MADLKPEFVSADELRAELDAFESAFGVRSERMVDAFRDANGDFVETDAYLAWNHAYAAWLIASGNLVTS